MPLSSVQQQERGRFAARDGYEQADFGSQVLTIKTRNGNRLLRVSISKLRVAEARKAAAIRLPQEGTALIQHGSVAKFVFDEFGIL